MTAILKVDTIQDTAGNNIINESSDTITIGASGDTTNIVGTLQNNGSALVTGKILQVISASKNDTFTTTSTSFVDVTGLTADITPASSSNKVLVMASFPVRFYKTSNYYANGMFNLKRDTTNIIARSGSNVQDFGVEAGALGSSSYVSNPIKMHMQILDSPSTTSQVTYSTRGAISSTSNNGTARFQNSSVFSVITVMEVLA